VCLAASVTFKTCVRCSRGSRLQPGLLVAQRAGGRGHHGALGLQPAQHGGRRLAARGRGGRIAPECGRLRRQAALLLARLGQRLLDELHVVCSVVWVRPWGSSGDAQCVCITSVMSSALLLVTLHGPPLPAAVLQRVSGSNS